MGKKISVFRENDVEYLKDYLIEVIRQVINEEPDAAAVQQINDWGGKNNLEVVEKQAGVLVIKVPPKEEGGKKVDSRGEVVQQLLKDLEPLGFVYDSTRGGSFGRFVKPGVRGESTQLIVLIKPTIPTGGGAAAAAGMDAEVKLATYVSEKYADQGITAKTAGSGHGSDLEIMAAGKEPMTIEVKTALGADFGQFRMGYNTVSKSWEPTQTAGFLKNKELFQDIFDTVIGPYMDKNAQFTPDMLQSPSVRLKDKVIKSLKPLKGTGDFKKRLQSEWFGTTDVRVDFDFAKISNYYGAKGDKFIQIGRGKGLYALNAEDAAEMGVPSFTDAGLRGIVRIRIKPHQGYDGVHSFTVAIKIAGTLEKSSLDLTNNQDLDKIVARFLNT